MPRQQRLAGSALILIVTALSACDNVEWGGADLDIVPPPPKVVAIEPEAQRFAELGLPSGTVLFNVLKGEGGGQLIPVAEVSGDSLRTLRRPPNVSPQAYAQNFRDAVFPVGSRFELFRRGARVGTFTVEGYGETVRCGVPTATGNLTTVAAAADVPEFIAFRQGLAPEVRGEYSPPQITTPINTYASIVAERLVLQNGLPRPRSWPGARKDLEAIEIMEGSNPEMAATYLVGDSLAVGPADPKGYSVFYIADYDRKRGYLPVYSEVRDYGKTGKAAPELVDYLDWDAIGGEEILIRVYGTDRVWYEVVSQDEGGDWGRVWEGGRC